MENNIYTNPSDALENLRSHRDQYIDEIKRRKKQAILTKARALNSLVQNKNIVPLSQHVNEVVQKIDEMTFDISELGACLEATYSSNELKTFYGFAGIYRLLFSDDWKMETAKLLVMTPNIASHLADSLEGIRLVSPIIHCLTNRIQDLEHSLIKKYGIPLLLELREKITETDSLESVICEITNLTYSSTEFRDAFLERDTMKILIRMTETENVEEICDRVIYAIGELCRGHPLPALELIEPALPIIWDAIKSNSKHKDLALHIIETNVQVQNRRTKFVPDDVLSILIEDLKSETLSKWNWSNRMTILDTISPEVPMSVLDLIEIASKIQNNQKIPQYDILIIVKKILVLFLEQIEDILENSESIEALFSIAFKNNYFQEGQFKNELRYIFALMVQKINSDGWNDLKERGILIILESCLNVKEPESLIEVTLKGIQNVASFDKNLLKEKIIDNVRELMGFGSVEIQNEISRIFNYLRIVKDL